MTTAAKPRARTAAERQKAYRERRASEAGEQRINAWVNARAIKALNSLALRYGVTQKIMLERLILNADDGVIALKPQPAKSTPAVRNKATAGVTRSRAEPEAAQIALWDEPVIETPDKPRRQGKTG